MWIKKTADKLRARVRNSGCAPIGGRKPPFADNPSPTNSTSILYNPALRRARCYSARNLSTSAGLVTPDAAHVSRNVTTYGMSEIARGRSRSCSLAGAAPRYWDRIRSTQSEAIVMVIPGSYVGYYTRHGEWQSPRLSATIFYMWRTNLVYMKRYTIIAHSRSERRENSCSVMLIL